MKHIQYKLTRNKEVVEEGFTTCWEDTLEDAFKTVLEEVELSLGDAIEMKIVPLNFRNSKIIIENEL